MIRINVEEEKCVDCGACIAVCSSQALSLDRVIWSLVYDEQKCQAVSHV